jgi:hypothetical protein
MKSENIEIVPILSTAILKMVEFALDFLDDATVSKMAANKIGILLMVSDL